MHLVDSGSELMCQTKLCYARDKLQTELFFIVFLYRSEKSKRFNVIYLFIYASLGEVVLVFETESPHLSQSIPKIVVLLP